VVLAVNALQSLVEEVTISEIELDCPMGALVQESAELAFVTE
jgi:hypothetical protein